MARYSIAQAKNVKGSTDWKVVEGLTDLQVRQAALADPDAKLFTEGEANQFKPLRTLKHRFGLKI